MLLTLFLCNFMYHFHVKRVNQIINITEIKHRYDNEIINKITIIHPESGLCVLNDFFHMYVMYLIVLHTIDITHFYIRSEIISKNS